MMINPNVFVFVLAAIFSFYSCGDKRKTRKLEKFDSSAWIADKDGCSGIRLAMKDSLLKAKYTMRGLRMNEIQRVLGHPDAEELAERNQKYYIYYLEPGPGCTHGLDTSLALFVRFSAVGIANEFTLKDF
jgi:hypothetical protein